MSQNHKAEVTGIMWMLLKLRLFKKNVCMYVFQARKYVSLCIAVKKTAL